MTANGGAATAAPGGTAVAAARGVRAATPARRRRLGGWRAALAPYGFVAPALLLLAAFGLLPILVAAGVSLTDLDIGGLGHPETIRFIGLGNYQRLFADPDFWHALGTTAFFVVIGVPTIIVVSLAVAVALNMSRSRFFRALRAFYFLPAITAIVAISLIWGYLYNSQFGLLNQLLAQVGVGPVGWLSEPTTARLSVALVAVWRATGLNIIIFLAALQSVPREYLEAAALDGAGRWTTFWRVTFPLLRFALFFVTVTTLIGWLQFFDEPYVLTKGGPVGATTSVSLFIFKNGFSLNQFGYASAGSIVLFVIIAAVTAVQLRMRRSDDA
ncbi:sugar ABC transporter permease [Actinotalea sp. M2MS4P-6]|uniref:carbohydrate ABC transporter permease n=1 Tax=Actinotalea sp. M2MS4P-6 TaxID=2983762 RepID=UPI0021E48C8F|nr:sugar ABC transporter permease [Actinotalea sp. M2MS4P-6]MCV2395196.1 sugar ABC transporter permease [Actinotalea sp. M2MS4P-6]